MPGFWQRSEIQVKASFSCCMSVLQVAWKMALQLGNHFFNWPFQTWMMCTSILAFNVMVAGLRLWLSAVWAPKPCISNNQGKPQFPWPADLGVHWSVPLLGGDIIYSGSPYTESAVTYQLSFITFLMGNRIGLLLKVSCEAAAVSLPLWGCKEGKVWRCCSLLQHPADQPSHSEMSQPAWKSSPTLL